MKQKIFTLIMMLALVIVAGRAFAQSTPKQPFVGATESYTVTGLTDADTYTFYVTLTGVTEDPASVDLTSGAGVFTWVGSETGSVASNEASVSVQWNSSAANYLLWIETSRGGCSNFRYVTIDPQPNTLDFLITVVGTGTGTYSGDIINDSDGASSCAVPVNYQYDDENVSPSDGQTYVYFRINRADGVTANAWEFDLDIDLEGANATLADIELSEDGTSGWASPADLLDISVAGGQNAYYARLLVDLTNADQTVAGTIANMLEATTNMAQNGTYTANDTDAIELLATPSAGTFGL